jgi:non-heme chloroperoxidase
MRATVRLRRDPTKRSEAMINVPDVVANYMAVWNEHDPQERRRRIRAVWAPNGVTLNRSLDARGYQAIETRVIGSWEKWLSEGKYIFKPKAIAQHHDIVKFDWVMTKIADGAVEACGVSFLILNPDGRIAYDYQFNPAANDAEDLAKRYVAIWNEKDGVVRRRHIEDLFATGGAYVNAVSTARGHAEISAEATAAQEAAIKGMSIVPAGLSQAHHNVALIQWRMQSGAATGATSGSDLLILDDEGRVRFDYQFEEGPARQEGEAMNAADLSEPIPPSRRVIEPNSIQTRDGTRLHWEATGHGRPLLFINSWAMTTRMWDYQIAAFCERGFRCIAYDRRGHGRSDRPIDGYDYDTFADDLAAVIEALDLDDVTLIGHSMAGGEIARYVTRHGSRRVGRAVMLAPTTPFQLKTDDNPNGGLPKENFEAVRAIWKRDFPQWVADNTAPFFTPETSPALIKWGIDILMDISLPVAIAVNRAVTETDFRTEMKAIDIPVLILHGDRDASAPLDWTGRASAALIPNCQLKVYEGAPHGLMYTHMERVHADILAFIEET